MIKKSNSQDPQWNAVILLEKATLQLTFHLREMAKVGGITLVVQSLSLHGVRLSRQLNSHLSETSWCLLDSNQTTFHLLLLEPCLLVSVAGSSPFYQANCPCWGGFTLSTFPTGDICCWRQSTCHFLRSGRQEGCIGSWEYALWPWQRWVTCFKKSQAQRST